MSKYGEITVNVFDHYKKQDLIDFAKKHRITLEMAVSLAKEKIYRKMYAERRNQDPSVKQKRKQYNQKRYELRKAL